MPDTHKLLSAQPGRWTYLGYVIRISRGGGKAGAGRNKTATLQVTEPLERGFLIRKQFTFQTRNHSSQEVALARCCQWIDQTVKEPA